jgi:hypothetical protein
MNAVDSSGRASSDLAGQLRCWLVFAGYILGGWAILNEISLFAAWGLPFNRPFRFVILNAIYRLASWLYFVSPVVLLAGCWGFQQHRRWARPVLLTYAGMWIAGVLGLHLVMFVKMLSGAYGDTTLRQRLGSSISALDIAVYASVFPVSLVLCLARREMRDHFPEFRTGFSPILGGEQE